MKTPPPPPRHLRRSAGYTLAELMIASSLAILVGGAALWLLTEGVSSSWNTANISSNDLSQWSINNRLLFDSRVATGVVVYTEFDSTVIGNEQDDGAGYVGDTDTTATGRGNFLLLYAARADNVLQRQIVTRLTGYVYNPTDHTVSRFIWPSTAADQTDLATDQANNLTYTQILTKRFSRIQALLQNGDRVARDAYVDEIDPTNKQAFSRRSPSEALLAFKLGNPLEARRVRDNRLIEVSFFIRN